MPQATTIIGAEASKKQKKRKKSPTCSPISLKFSSPVYFYSPHIPQSPPYLTQLLQGAVAADLRFHSQLIGRWQLGQVVEGMGEGRVAAIVSHAPSHDATTTNATATRTFAAT